MDALSDAYNAKLEAIADKYKGQPNGTFAVMYSPAPIDISSFPIDALRYVQGYSVLVEWIYSAVDWQQCGLLSSIPQGSSMDCKSLLGPVVLKEKRKAFNLDIRREFIDILPNN
ncbi:hypothetical protein G6F42_020155 [Rhizopus arrhizus]|nr:hypothetical protein G6F42_020155 [Rhizopus arrhizus]